MKVDECKQMGTIIQQGLETNFENLLCGNSITQEEANKIKAVINEAKTANQAFFVNTKKMTERSKIYMDNTDINYINSLKGLVDNGKLTQDQAKKIIMKQIYLCQTKWAIVYFKNLFRKD